MASQPLSFKARLRYGLPAQLARIMPEVGPAAVLGKAAWLEQAGHTVTFGHFPDNAGDPASIMAQCGELALMRTRAPSNTATTSAILAIKAPSLRFSSVDIAALTRLANERGMTTIFDSHAPGQADQTLAIVEAELARGADTGLAIPARWARSAADADLFRNGAARIRIVRGEWADPAQDRPDAAAYLDLVARVAGRAAPVGVATHDPDLAEQALGLLIAAGTPCELEQLHGLPRRRTMAIAHRLGVPVRVYLPYGPGWWPYAIDKTLARPHLPVWWLHDLVGYRRGS